MSVLLFGNYGHTNIGDEAILRGIVSLFLELNLELDVVTDDLFISKKIHSGYRIKFVCLKSVGKWKALRVLCELFRIFMVIKRSDGVVIGGGGLFNDYNFSAYFKYLFIIFTSSILKKKVTLLGVSIGPLKCNLKVSILRYWFGLAENVLLRDEKSLGLVRDAFLVKDMALYASVPVLSNFENSWGKKKLLVSWVGIEKVFDRNHLNVDIDAFLDFLRSRFSQEKYDVEIICMDFKKDFNAACGIRRLLSADGYHANVYVVDTLDKLDAIYGIGDYLLGTRLHSGILSILYGVPFRIFSYQEKVSNYFNSHGYSDNLVTLNVSEGCTSPLTKEELLMKIGGTYLR